MPYIYKLTNRANGKCYIGQTERKPEARWKSHQSCARNGSKKYIHTAIRHYGVEAFDLGILCEVKIDLLNAEESKFIALFKSNQKEFGYNLTDGGDHWKKTPEQCAAISERMKGNRNASGPKSEAHKRNIGIANKGRIGIWNGKKFSEEHRKKIGLATKRRAQSAEFIEIARQNGLANSGRKHTSETRDKMAQSRTGLKRSEETKRKMAESRRLWWANRKASYTIIN